MSDTKIIIDLFNYNFNIPYYQRGYKWEAQEVTELLDDLWDFNKNAQQGEFYCLQPIVVKSKGDNNYDVIDGQQRLTTIFLILSFLKNGAEEEGYNTNLFSLTYETRLESEEFINQLGFTKGINDSNVDFYYISSAYEVIQDWFKSHPGSKSKLTNLLFDVEDGKNKNVKFIWYDLQNENPIDAFIRLNVGKIPLTDAELIKALLLQTDRYSDEVRAVINKDLEKIGNEWDRIEYRLQEEEFWYFINDNKNAFPTHIEFIFNLISDKVLNSIEEISNKFEKKKPSKYGVYLILNEYLKHLKDTSKDTKDELFAIKKFWEEVVKYFENFNEWFTERKLFHYIGFILCVKRSSATIEELILKSTALNKDLFEKYLVNEIKALTNFQNTYNITESSKELKLLEMYNYDDDYQEIHRVLLLHNVILTLNSDKELSRFPFHLYKKTEKKEKWSLEHIHAQNSDLITNPEHQIQWLNDHKLLIESKGLEFLKDKEIISRIDAYLNGSVDKPKFEELYSDILEILDPNSNASKKHQLENLCLLDGRTNSSLNKSVFEVKRSKIRRRELSGHYIPIASRNIFLKTYTEYPKSSAYWDEIDKTEYINNIKSTLFDFLPQHLTITTNN